MNEGTRSEMLRNEEIKAMKLFIPLFYSIYIIYDLVYYYVIPYFYQEEMGRPSNGLGIFIYVFLLMVFPISVFLIKKGSPFQIK